MFSSWRMIVGLMLKLETRHCAEDFIETSISANQKPGLLKIDQSQDWEPSL